VLVADAEVVAIVVEVRVSVWRVVSGKVAVSVEVAASGVVLVEVGVVMGLIK
jgi:hypothetical protein